MRQWLRHRKRGMLIARRAASRAARSGAGIVRATPPRTRGHTTLDEQHSQHGSREQKDRALARPPPDESAEPTREEEQLGQRKPLPRRPARHARCRGSAGRRLDARRPSRAPSGLQARARAASGQPFRSPRGRVGGRARAAPRAADTRLALPALRARRPRAQPPSSRGWRHTLAGQIAQPPTSRKIRPAGRGGRLGR